MIKVLDLSLREFNLNIKWNVSSTQKSIWPSKYEVQSQLGNVKRAAQKPPKSTFLDQMKHLKKQGPNEKRIP